MVAPQLGPAWLNRKICSACDQHSKCSHNLLPTLAHHDRYKFLRSEALWEKLLGYKIGVCQQLSILHCAIAPRHGDAIRRFHRLFDEQFVEAAVDDLRLCVIYKVSFLPLRSRQLGNIFSQPGVRISRKQVQEIAVRFEHVIEHSRKKHFFDGIPVDNQITVYLEYLIVEPNLRRLANAIVHGTKLL